MATAALILLVAGPATAAPAINVTPGSLPACTDGAPSEFGGWNKRLLFGSGTDNEDWGFQVRPRALALGEPCIDAGFFAFPHAVHDLPSEGSYGEVGGPVLRCADNDGLNCGIFKGFGQTVSTGIVNRLCFSFTGDNSPAQEITLRAGSGPAGSGTTTDGGTVATMKATFLGSTVACPPGSNAVSSYVCGSPCTTLAGPIWEWRFGTTSVANSAWTGNMEYIDAISFWGAEIGARMSVGNYGPAANDSQIFCSTSSNGAVTTTLNVSGYDPIPYDYLPEFDPGDTGYEDPIWQKNGQHGTGVSAGACSYIVKITVTVCSYDADHDEVCELLTWTSQRYHDATPYTDDTPEVGICIRFPSNPNCTGIVEPPIVCDITYSDPGNPITVIGEFFGGLGPWAYCMVVPQGWDRGKIIDRSWSEGNIGEFVESVDAAIPNGIACGEIAEIPLLDTSVDIDTCDVDVAPSWVKYAVSGVIIIGVAALAIKRIMWAVGSKG